MSKEIQSPEDMVILMVEDRKDDMVLIREAFRKSEVKNPLFIVRDGEEAQAYLEGIGKYRQRAEFPLPNLVLLDRKMPKMDGFELLEWIRNHPAFKAIRIVVLTSSQDICDVSKAYELGTNSFRGKPHDFMNFTAMMRTLGSFWVRHSPAPCLDRPPQEEPTTRDGGND
jgi:CheY-like chemotaxis protein